MTVSTYDPIWVRGKGRIQISGMFYPQNTGTPLFGATALLANASAIKAGSSSASGWTVARTGVGLFVVTIKDANVAELIDGQVSLGLAVAADAYAQMGPVVLTAGVATVGISTISGAAATDNVAGVDTRVCFRFTFRRSSVKG